MSPRPWRTRQETRADHTGETTAGPRTHRKNLREFCKGNPKTPHTPEVALASWAVSLKIPCRWIGYDYDWEARQPRDYRWTCLHRVVCSGCGKVLEEPMSPSWSCPDFHSREKT